LKSQAVREVAALALKQLEQSGSDPN